MTLRDLLQAEIKTLDNPWQIGAFRRELAKRLPDVIRAASEEAKKDPKTAQVKTNPAGLSNNDWK